MNWLCLFSITHRQTTKWKCQVERIAKTSIKFFYHSYVCTQIRSIFDFGRHLLSFHGDPGTFKKGYLYKVNIIILLLICACLLSSIYLKRTNPVSFSNNMKKDDLTIFEQHKIGAAPFPMQLNIHGPACPSHLCQI